MRKRCPFADGRTEKDGISRRTFIKGSAAATASLLAFSSSRLAWAQPGPLIVDVSGVPVPDFSTTSYHTGVEVLLRTLSCSGVPFYRADSRYPLSDPLMGLIAPDDVVVIKVNGQWQYRGITNSDVVRGVIQRILDHPEGFTGEVLIMENGQGRGSLDGMGSPGSYPGSTGSHANAEDETHTFQYLIDWFSDQGWPVSGHLLDSVRTNWNDDPGAHTGDFYRHADFVSYPCFTTAGGNRIELRDGIWDDVAGLHRQNLKLINIPVFKTHGGSAVTGALKNMYGVLSMDYNSGAYHYDWIGRATADMHTLVRTPALNIIDCIWVSPAELRGRDGTVRTNKLLAGFDPVALDYYAGKQILYPAGGDPYHDPDTSSEYIACLVEARDQINANGGIHGQEATFDEGLFQVVAADASVAEEPAGTLRLTQEAGQTRLQWEGGTPPFRIWRSESKDFANPTLLTECCTDNTFIDPDTLLDGTRYYYRVE